MTLALWPVPRGAAETQAAPTPGYYQPAATGTLSDPGLIASLL